jgi:hypothetical protein
MKGDDKKIYVTELLSSGADDNITIEFSIILFIPLLIVSLFRIKINIKLIEYLFNNLTILLQIILLFCIDAGSIFNTIIYDNKVLLIWVISFVIFIFSTQLFFLINLSTIRSVHSRVTRIL